jgi:23S rRNA (adenine2030-N6)-methyltransferase
LEPLVRPYLDCVGSFGKAAGGAIYPGSPAIAQKLLRQQDRMIFCELYPPAFESLKHHIGRDKRAKLLALDGYTGLNACIPPKERRGLVLIDPPFEEKNEFTRLSAAIAAAYRKWPTGIYMAWYPVKDMRACASFAKELVQNGMKRLLRIELQIAALKLDEGLARTGLLIANAPFGLDEDMRLLLPWLTRELACGNASEHQIEWLAGE